VINRLIEISKLAGDAIMEVYKKDDFHEQKKADNSPVTAADLAANKIIVEELQKSFSHIPVLTEESEKANYDIRKNWEEYFLVDPLDGTKEFIKKNDEFTVNIALIKNRAPVLGVVYAPALDVLYYNRDEASAFKVEGANEMALPIASDRDSFVMTASRSHLNEATQELYDELQEKHDGIELLRMGSSLKLCLVAEGRVDIYPRRGPTSEWDTAAAHAVVRASGGDVYQYGTKDSLIYNKKDLLNPHFEVVRHR